MYHRHSFKTESFPAQTVSSPLKAMSEQEFAALGADTVVFLRSISGEHLASFIPEAKTTPEDAQFQMIMSADGALVLVTDNDEAIDSWLEDRDVTLVQRH